MIPGGQGRQSCTCFVCLPLSVPGLSGEGKGGEQEKERKGEEGRGGEVLVFLFYKAAHTFH